MYFYNNPQHKLGHFAGWQLLVLYLELCKLNLFVFVTPSSPVSMVGLVSPTQLEEEVEACCVVPSFVRQLASHLHVIVTGMKMSMLSQTMLGVCA